MGTQLEKVNQFLGTPRKLRLAEQVITAEHEQIRPGRKRFNQRVLLQGYAEPGADGAQVAADVHAKHANHAARGARHAVDHPQGGGFSGAIGSQKAETEARGNLQIQAVDGYAVGEFFGNRLCFDDGRIRRRQ